MNDGGSVPVTVCTAAAEGIMQRETSVLSTQETSASLDSTQWNMTGNSVEETDDV